MRVKLSLTTSSHLLPRTGGAGAGSSLHPSAVGVSLAAADDSSSSHGLVVSRPTCCLSVITTKSLISPYPDLHDDCVGPTGAHEAGGAEPRTDPCRSAELGLVRHRAVENVNTWAVHPPFVTLIICVSLVLWSKGPVQFVNNTAEKKPLLHIPFAFTHMDRKIRRR
jgi:hypothetical protein